MSAVAYDAFSVDTSFPFPSGAAGSPSGDIFLAVGNRVIVYKPSQSKYYPFCGSNQAGYLDGHRFEARLSNILGICLSADGELLISDSGNHRICIVKKDGIVCTFAGTGVVGSQNGARSEASFSSPAGLCLALNGDIYVADSGNNVIRRISRSTGEVTTFCGSGAAGNTPGWAAAANINRPSTLRMGFGGELLVGTNSVNGHDNHVFAVYPDGRFSKLYLARRSSTILDFYPCFRTGSIHVAYKEEGQLIIERLAVEEASEAPAKYGSGGLIEASSLNECLPYIAPSVLPHSNHQYARLLIEGDDIYSPRHQIIVKVEPSLMVKDAIALMNVENHFVEPHGDGDLVLLGPDGVMLSTSEQLAPYIQSYLKIASQGGGGSNLANPQDLRGDHIPPLPPTFRLTRPIVNCFVDFREFGQVNSFMHSIEGGYSLQKLMHSLAEDPSLLPIQLQVLVRNSSLDPPRKGQSSQISDVAAYQFDLFRITPFNVNVEFAASSCAFLVHPSEVLQDFHSRLLEYFKVPTSCRLIVNKKPIYMAGAIGHTDIHESTIITLEPRSADTRLFLKNIKGKTITLEGYEPKDYVLDIFAEIQSKEGCPIYQQRAIFVGKVLKKEHLLADYNIQDQSTIITIGL
jgi:hypothetical protein